RSLGSLTPLGALAPRSPLAPLASFRTLATRPALAFRERRRHRRTGGRSDELEPLGFRPLRLRREHRGHRDALDLEVGLRPHDVADLRAFVEQLRLEHALRLPCTGR